MTVLYDNIEVNKEIDLDLPFREGVGTITRDVSKNHSLVSLVNTPTWTTLASGLKVLTLNGTNEYLRCLAAACTDLDYTSGDFSIGCWVNRSAGDDSQILIGRYHLSDAGWELYFYTTGSLTLRLHHSGGAATRTANYSMGWTLGQWEMIGISREGAAAAHFRDGVELEVTGDALEDPETCDHNLVIGARYTVDSNYYKGMLWRPRVWPKALTGADWKALYEKEKGWFA